MNNYKTRLISARESSDPMILKLSRFFLCGADNLLYNYYWNICSFKMGKWGNSVHSFTGEVIISICSNVDGK